MKISMTLAFAGIKTSFLGLLRWMARHPFLALVILLFAWRSYGELMKAYWDWKIDRMCASEQMLQIFVAERIPPDPGRIGPMGHYVPKKPQFPARSEREYRAGDVYFETWVEEIIREGSPSVSRFTTEVLRAASGEILARRIYYARAGGDFFPIDHFSSYGCGPSERLLIDSLFASPSRRASFLLDLDRNVFFG